MTNYRVLVNATKGEQLVVERQYRTGPESWTTIDKYLTTNLAQLPKRREAWMKEAVAMFASGTGCCATPQPVTDPETNTQYCGVCSQPLDGGRHLLVLPPANEYGSRTGEVPTIENGGLGEGLPRANAEVGAVYGISSLQKFAVGAAGRSQRGKSKPDHAHEVTKNDAGMDHDFVDPETILPSIY